MRRRLWKPTPHDLPYIRAHPRPHHWLTQYTSRTTEPNVFRRRLLSLTKALRRAYVAAPMLTSLQTRRSALIRTKSHHSISLLSLLKDCPIIPIHISRRITTIFLITVAITTLIITHPNQRLLSQIRLMLARISATWHQHQTSNQWPNARLYRTLR